MTPSLPPSGLRLAEASPTLRMRRRASAPLSADAFPRGSEYPFMLEKEWTPDAAWDVPAEDLAAFGAMAERLFGLAVEVADETLADGRALERFGLGAVADGLRRSRERGAEALLTRLDFALEPVGPDTWAPRFLELNGDTAGNVVEGALLQREWGEAVGTPTAGDGMEAALATALRALPEPLVVWHHPGDPYLLCHGRYLAALGGCARVEYPRVPREDVRSVYKVFRWGRLWAGRFPEVGGWIATREARVHEPAWCALLQHKGLLARMWDRAPTTPGLLPTTLEGPAALPDGGATGWAEKSFYGVSGYEVTVSPPGAAPPPARAGHVWQTRVPLVAVDGLYPFLCATLVNGRFAGALIREDDTFVSTDDIVTPLAVLRRPDPGGRA